ncbi:MAG: DUF58 domain-containing protein [Cytophagales bacterium]|nr:DUF58 domain-containing protein [Cytophagales bacterium]
MSQNISTEHVKSISNLELLARQIVEGFITGLHKSPFHGFSVEFAEHRLYNTGESTRHIDWKVYSKTDKLFIKKYEEETNMRSVILLDISSSMYYPIPQAGKLRFAIQAAAALMYLLSRQRDAVGYITFDNKIIYRSDIKSNTVHIRNMIEQLSTLLDSTPPKNNTTKIAPVLHSIAESIHKRSMVVIFSDFFDNPDNTNEIFDAIKHLKHKQHEIIIFHVKDTMTEDNLQFEQRPYSFIDVETGQKIKLLPHQLADLYKSKINAWNESIKIRCGQYKIDYVEADVHKDFRQVLMPFFIKRAKMG